MKDCEYYQGLISCLIDRELSKAEAEELRAHASECAECRALYAAFSGLDTLLQGDLAEPPEALHETVMADIRREEIKAYQKKRKQTKKAVKMAASFAIVIAIGGGIFAASSLRMGRAAETPMMAASMDTTEAAMEAAPAPAEEAQSENENETLRTAGEEKSLDEQIAEAMERVQVTESVTELYDVSGQGRGDRIHSLLTGQTCPAPEGRTPDRHFILRYDPKEGTQRAVISVYGNQVYFIFFGGEESELTLADCSWNELYDAIYG